MMGITLNPATIARRAWAIVVSKWRAAVPMQLARVLANWWGA